MLRRLAFALCLPLASAALPASAAGRLVVEEGWIRTAPPGARMLAGYARLRNAGDAPLVVTGAASPAFADVSLHATVLEDGVSKMRPLPRLTIAPGASEMLAPGGMHLMLMGPSTALDAGAKASIAFTVEGGGEAAGEFVVRDGASAAEPHAHH